MSSQSNGEQAPAHPERPTSEEWNRISIAKNKEHKWEL
jgi:hypothetical protein